MLVLIRDTNGNTLGTFDLGLDEDRYADTVEAHFSDSGSLIITLEPVEELVESEVATDY